MVKNIFKPNRLRQSMIARINSEIENIHPERFTFIDSIYHNFYRIIEETANVEKPPVLFGKEIDLQVFRKLSDSSRYISGLSHRCMPELYNEMRDVVEIMYTDIDDISRKSDMVHYILEEAEDAIKTRNNVISIKDEKIVHSDFILTDYFDEGNITIDRRIGFATLEILNYKKVDYKIDSSEFNKPLGKWKHPERGVPTKDLYDNGVFFSRAFSENPVFQIDEDKNLVRIKDGLVGTGIEAEYNTTEVDKLSWKLDLKVNRAKVDAIEIISDMMDNDSIISQNPLTIKVGAIRVTRGDSTIDMIPHISENSLSVRGLSYTRDRTRINKSKVDNYPTVLLPINQNECTNISILLESDSPQTVYHFEKLITKRDGTPTHRLNYFETLLTNNYQSPNGRPNPTDLYTDESKQSIYNLYYNSGGQENIVVEQQRYSIAIKEISLLSHTYSNEAFGITRNLNESGRNIATIDIYADEDASKDQITYQISTDKLEWHDIVPANKETKGIKRYTFQGFDGRTEQDGFIPGDNDKIYLKIKMKQGAKVPYLRSYAARIKLL